MMGHYNSLQQKEATRILTTSILAESSGSFDRWNVLETVHHTVKHQRKRKDTYIPADIET